MNTVLQLHQGLTVMSSILLRRDYKVSLKLFSQQWILFIFMQIKLGTENLYLSSCKGILLPFIYLEIKLLSDNK